MDDSRTSPAYNTEDTKMSEKMRYRKLWVFVLVGLAFFACEKKAEQADEAVNAAQADSGKRETVRKTRRGSGKMRLPDYHGDIIQNNIDLDDLEKIITLRWWDMFIQNDIVEIDFNLNGTYSLKGRPAAWGQPIYGDFASGEYEVSGESVILHYPFKIQGSGDTAVFADKILGWLFDGENDRILVYDKAFRNYDRATCLRFDDKIMTNADLKSPYGGEYKTYVGGEEPWIPVIKCDHSVTLVEILENLKMREYPDINADTVTVSVTSLDGYCMYKNPWERPTGTERNIVMTGEHYDYYEKTVKQDTIDGITAPWYKIYVQQNEIYSEAVWVFGGYLKEYTPEEVTEWWKKEKENAPEEVTEW
jgi:hypothetical protein